MLQELRCSYHGSEWKNHKDQTCLSAVGVAPMPVSVKDVLMQCAWPENRH